VKIQIHKQYPGTVVPLPQLVPAVVKNEGEETQTTKTTKEEDSESVSETEEEENKPPSHLLLLQPPLYNPSLPHLDQVLPPSFKQAIAPNRWKKVQKSNYQSNHCEVLSGLFGYIGRYAQLKLFQDSIVGGEKGEDLFRGNSSYNKEDETDTDSEETPLMSDARRTVSRTNSKSAKKLVSDILLSRPSFPGAPNRGFHSVLPIKTL
jgi:hypothetical protein